jgi:hypothetical protein
MIQYINDSQTSENQESEYCMWSSVKTCGVRTKIPTEQENHPQSITQSARYLKTGISKQENRLREDHTQRRTVAINLLEIAGICGKQRKQKHAEALDTKIGRKCRIAIFHQIGMKD